MPDVYFSEIDFGDGIARKPRVAGSGGHTIVDESGTQFTQRANLVVENAHVEDDATNNATVLKSKNFVGHKSVWDAMTREEKSQYETYDFDDDFNGQTVDATPTQGSTNPVQSGGVYSEIQTIEGDIQTVSNKVSNSGDAYSPSKPYNVGDLVIHDNVLYRCITRCSAAAWSVNQSCFTTDTLINTATLLNTRLTAISNFYQSNFNESRTIGTGIGCGYIHNLPKGIYLVYTEVGFTKNLSAGARRQVFEGETDLQLNIAILDEFDPYWHSVRSVTLLGWQDTRDIYFTAISSDTTDSFSFASVTCIPINI